MKLYPTEHAQVLVDNDYIMASLGVLSKRYREAAIRLLEKSLNFKFPERTQQSEQVRIMAELQELADADAAKKAELAKHIQEMEDMGYDMDAYKNPDAIGGASEEEIEAAKKEALGANLVENVPGHVTSQQQAGNPHVMRTCDDVEGKMPSCDRKCRLCYRKHCKFRQE